MPVPPSLPLSPTARVRRRPWCPTLALAALLSLPGPSRAAGPDSLPDAGAGAPGAAAAAVAGLGLENVTVAPGGGVAFENRRYRHSAEARGRAVSALAVPAGTAITFFERRLGLVAAAVFDTGGGVPAGVRFPTDPGFPGPPTGPRLAPTTRSFDLELVPRLTYELGRLYDPVLIRVELEPRLRYNPWPGGRATASLLLPLRNDFSLDALHPDINRVRPGRLTFEQFAWSPGLALVSGTAGILGGNRYGLSVGAARPVSGGRFLIDLQADLTGYIAFPETGTEYSGLSRWTGFGAVTWRPPHLDVGVRLSGHRFLHADQGGELEVRRSFEDLDVAFFYQRTAGLNIQGVRLAIPVPPMVRPTGQAIRVLPVERFGLDYRDKAEPAGIALKGVASREEFLRQLSEPGLAANTHRYRAGRGLGPGEARPRVFEPVSLTGMTGFINTPWCGVMAERTVEIGYQRIPREAAYDHRGEHRNEVYYAALGFLPRIEAGLRWTVIPGLKTLSDLVPDSRLTDSDRMLSGRLELVTPRPGRPGLAVGIEDAFGTRRFHSTYAVTGLPFEFRRLQSRLSLGYAHRVLTASRHTLDGAFGAVGVTLGRPVAVTLEYDTEKWNTSLGINLGFGFRARAAWLDGRHASLGGGWAVAL